ncbi:type VI secretion system membrane subunit TssM [Halovibrio salipaludis]|uniref:Type VI secretion system membrane subunit TssM n=2 Tax=Halovibrio salipaludis TaxID=2032626 RepID=A0A2A2FBZ5_9GAMM|nr:type VI secretion system membrane subunit TssM [Halovibrio salipaludis]
MRLMAWMRSLGKWITLRGVLISLAVVALLLLIWFGGPLVAIAGWTPLGSVASRLVFLLCLLVVGLGVALWRARRQRADNEKVVSEMIADNDGDELLQEEVSEQRERLREALALVRRWRPGRFRSVYDLPWYILIGAPGSGKSTALLNSGLDFPLRDRMGVESVRGVGGTRNCDWWFTNRAVVIDTAGRYTAQESADRRDARGWESFLGLLRRYRPRQPINGAILSISVADLLEQTPTERALHARALKQRVQELRNRLGVIFPVYVVLTKTDLLEGFTETFGMLTEAERDEVLGMTFELEPAPDSEALAARFSEAFDGLIERLSHFSLHRVQQERTTGATRRLYHFPKQVALLRAPVWNLISEVFCPSAYEDTAQLRGIYLVSAEQAQHGYDRVSQLVDDEFGITPARAEPETVGISPNGFFLRRLFDSIVFSEHGLVRPDGQHRWRLRWLQRGVVAVLALVMAGSGMAWAFSYQWNRALIVDYEQDLEKVEKADEAGPENWVRLEQLLSRAASLPGVADTGFPEGGPRNVGLDQGARLSQLGEGAYGRLLQHHFSSHLREALEQALAENPENTEYLYETLKTYLMLNQHQHLEPQQVRDWFEAWLEQELAGSANESTRTRLQEHLDRYLALGHRMALDSERVGKAREQLARLPVDERAYERIRLSARASDFPDFRLPLVLGSVADRVFERRSGKPLDEPIPALYTRNGFEGLFRPGLEQVSQRLLAESWVYGEDSAPFRNLDEAALKQGVRDRYFRDYVYRWRDLLMDLRIRSYEQQAEGARIAAAIAGPEAPVERLMKAVTHNTRLAPVLESKGGELADAASEQAGRVADRASGRGPRLSSLMPADEGTDEAPSTPVDDAFSELHEVPSETYQSLRDNADTIADHLGEGEAGLAQGDFRKAVNGLHETVDGTESDSLGALFSGFLQDGRRLDQASRTRNLNELWRSQVYAEYREAISGHYPVDLDASESIALQDFVRFFDYGGTLDAFVEEHLAGRIDRSSSPWKVTGGLDIQPRTLRLLEHAERIRSAFFNPDGGGLAVGFSLRPTQLDADVTRLDLALGDQTLVYRHGPEREQGFHWPLKADAGISTLSLKPGAEGAAPLRRRYQGEWSVFRLLQSAGALTGSGRSRDVTVEMDGYSAAFELTADSVRHPFSRDLFKPFWLPPDL